MKQLRYIIIIFVLISATSTFAQVTDTSKAQSVQPTEEITFTVKVDKANATKDGIYLKGYVVNIPYEQIERLHGKIIKLTGKVTKVKGLNNCKEFDENGREIIKQGRAEDYKYIRSPKIEVLD